MVITAKFPEIVDDLSPAMMASRPLTIEPADLVNLTVFLELNKKAGK